MIDYKEHKYRLEFWMWAKGIGMDVMMRSRILGKYYKWDTEDEKEDR